MYTHTYTHTHTHTHTHDRAGVRISEHSKLRKRKCFGQGKCNAFLKFIETSLVVWWSELLATNHEVPGSIPGSTMGIFLVGGGSPW